MVKKHKDHIEKNNLSELLLNSNLNDFWRVIRLKKNKKGKVPNIVDNEVGSHYICNLFKNMYKSLYSSVLIENKVKELHHNRSNIGSTLLYVNEIISAKKLLKKGKGDGNISSMSDYIINMSHKFSIILTFVLNGLIVHNIIPHEMLSGTIVPIYKNKRKSLNDSLNYRRITLNSIVGKLMDNAIFDKTPRLT